MKDAGQGVWQNCSIGTQFTSSQATFSFFVDGTLLQLLIEWDMVTNAQVISMTKNGTTIKQGETTTLGVATYRQLIGIEESYPQVSYFHEGANILFDPTIDYLSSQGALFSNIMSWGTDPSGLYISKSIFIYY